MKILKEIEQENKKLKRKLKIAKDEIVRLKTILHNNSFQLSHDNQWRKFE